MKCSLLFLLFFISSYQYINAEIRKFPKNFKFGTATASYQIEGAWNVSDKAESIWDHLVHYTNLVDGRMNGDIACDSYNLYKRDVEMMKEIGVDFYRFSISWPRLLPNGFANKISKDGLRYYNALIDELISKNIQPYVTLYHWDLPQNLQLLGGWANPIMAEYFEDYAKIAFESFGDRVKTWVTFNEPRGFCMEGYDIQKNAPALNMSGFGGYLCTHTVLKAHAKAYHLYDKHFRDKQKGRVSLTLDASWEEPETDSIDDKVAAETAMQFEVGWYGHPIYSPEGDYPEVMKKLIANNSLAQGLPSSRLPQFTAEEVDFIRGTHDFFGLNHYSTHIVKKGLNFSMEPSFNNDEGVIKYLRDDWPPSASSWLKEVPWGFTKLLGWIREEYDNPEVVVLENGFSDLDGLEDYARIHYLHSYMNALLDAVDQGSNISTYTVWSLMDNFEWLDGYIPRFGIYHVDFEDPQRTRRPKDSAHFFAKVIKNRAIERTTPNKHLAIISV